MSLACLGPLFTQPAAADDSAAYLAQHQAELMPFFAAHGPALIKDCLPILVSVVGHLLLATALFGWGIDILLAWGFSIIFAPAYAKFVRALIYASGRLVLALLFTVVLSFSALLGLNAGAGLPALLIAAVLTVPAIVLQVCWVSYQYRTGPRPSLLFYGTLLLVHLLALAILVPTLFAQQVNAGIAQAMDESVVPELQAAAARVRTDSAAAAAKRDGIEAEVKMLQGRIAQDQSDEQALQKQIAADQNAPAVVFRHLVLLRAQGDLADAGKGLADFMRQYPNDPQAEAARGQLAGVNEALATQRALARRQEAANAAAEARARAQLLAHASAGQATLSEMRRALLGKSRADVAGLFGPPSATEADRWGYSKRMIFDPETHGSLGLTVVFSEGFVQGVDYYYGGGP